MVTERRPHIGRKRIGRLIGWIALLLCAVAAGCSGLPVTGLIYTNVKAPLTRNLDATPMPPHPPQDGRVIEIREPVTGLGISAKIQSNAIGDIAKTCGLKTVYFADQEVFSLLGIWTTQKAIIYGR
jgi:hypothetical protein